jgi:predicted MFS family arabinose efflux permease
MKERSFFSHGAAGVGAAGVGAAGGGAAGGAEAGALAGAAAGDAAGGAEAGAAAEAAARGAAGGAEAGAAARGAAGDAAGGAEAGAAARGAAGDAAGGGAARTAAARAHADAAPAVSGPALPRSLALLFAVASGLAVGNAYAAQPLLDAIADAFALSHAAAGAVVTATQAGLALGLVLVVPLGDVLARRRLVPAQLLVGASALAVVAATHSGPLLLAAVAVVGASSVVAQVLVAYAAALAGEHDRGRAVGLVTSGVISGILLSRAVAGLIAELAGWRAVYAASAVATLVLAALLARRLPREQPDPGDVRGLAAVRRPASPQRGRVAPAPAAPRPAGTPEAPTAPRRDGAEYVRLVASTATLVARMPLLRVRGGLALLSFAAFSTLWSSLVLPLSGPPHHLSHATIGLFGLAGAAGAFAAARAGHLADRGRGQATTGAALALLLASWLPIALLDRSLLALAVGVVLLDLAVQAVHVTNQTLLLTDAGPHRSRVTAACMVFYSLGSAGGAIAATSVYAAAGWGAVCVLGAALSAAALLLWALTLTR